MCVSAATAVAVSCKCGNTSSSVAVTRRVIMSTALVATGFDGFGREEIVKVFPMIVVCPSLYDLEHVVMYLALWVSGSWVVEDAHTVIQNLVDWNVWVVPSIDYAGCNVLQDGYGDLTSRLVQDVCKVVFGQHAVCWVGGVWVSPDFILVLGC